MDVIHHIIGLSRVGTNPTLHFVGKKLDRKLVVKLTKEFKLSKGGRAYDAKDIKDEVMRLTI